MAHCTAPKPFDWGDSACRKLRHTYLMSLRASDSAACRQHSGSCYLQIPKTASTTMKNAFALPINLKPDQRSLSDNCTSVLASVRDPGDRFISGVGTVWNRFHADLKACQNKRADGECTDQDQTHSLSLASVPETLDATTFEAYAWRVLDAVRNASTCSSMLKLKHATHLLPQQTFIDLACLTDETSLPSLRHVFTTDSPDAMMSDGGASCAQTITKHLNVHEGQKQAGGLQMSPALLREVSAFYAADAELLPARRQQGGQDTTILPSLGPLGLCNVLSGISGSLECAQPCRDERALELSCPTSSALVCFGNGQLLPKEKLLCPNGGPVRCSCREPILGPLPPRGSAESQRHLSVAVLTAGMTRSFLSEPVQASFRALLKQLKLLQGQPVLMAALDLVSANRKDKVPGVKPSPRLFTRASLDGALRSFGVPWRARYLSFGNLLSAAELASTDCNHRQLCALLNITTDPASSTKGCSGVCLGIAKRLLAFDLLLSYERDTQSSPEHVLFMRPDVLYVFSPHDPVAALCRAVYVKNDLFAAMPRAYAGYYFTYFATCSRALRRIDTAADQALVHELKNAVSPDHGGLVCMPHFHLAYHGVPFAGDGLEMSPPTIKCAEVNPIMSLVIVRDVPSTMPAKVCTDHPLPNAARKFLAANHVPTLDVCTNMSARGAT